MCLAFAAENPDDVLVRVTMARLHDLLGRPEHALAALEEALRSTRGMPRPWLRWRTCTNGRTGSANSRRPSPASMRSTQISPNCRCSRPGWPIVGRLPPRAQLARRAPEVADPGSRAQLIGQISDRLGDSAAAFAAFEEMNRDAGVAPEVARARAEAYRKLLARRMRLATRKWVRSWTRVSPAAEQRDPVFLVGFPRSGTTLLDTLLLGHSAVRVAEEKPMLDSVIRSVGGYDRISNLDAGELATLRNLYFAEAAAQVPDLGDRMLIDKHPLR